MHRMNFTIKKNALKYNKMCYIFENRVHTSIENDKYTSPTAHTLVNTEITCITCILSFFF